MKTREEIRKFSTEVLESGNVLAGVVAMLAMHGELLCDIRDLLQQPQTVNHFFTGSPETEEAFVKAIEQMTRRGRV